MESSASSSSATTPTSGIEFQDKLLHHVGDQLMVYVDQFKGTVKVHVRKFGYNDQKDTIFPTKEGLSLKLEEFQMLTKFTQENMERLREKEALITQTFREAKPTAEPPVYDTASKKRKFFD